MLPPPHETTNPPVYLEVIPFDVGDIHIMSGRADIFVFLASKDVNTDQVDLHVRIT